jgi:hypothetical protein
VVVDLETIGFQMSDPLFAATAIGIAVHIDRDRFGGLGQRGDEQGRKGCQTQCGFHRLSLVGRCIQGGQGTTVNFQPKGILTIFTDKKGRLCFKVIQIPSGLTRRIRNDFNRFTLSVN